MKKNLIKILFVSTFLFYSLTINHIHNETCGYDLETGNGCIYEFDPNIHPNNEDKPHL